MSVIGNYVESSQHEIFNANISEFSSEKSGMRVVVVQMERPIVDAVFVVPTEATDDFGCAHTLEHLIFLGSKTHPYSGVLDALAGRCLAQGTNAWTDTDHTAYTASTAGYQGFLNILQEYLEHILYPVLSEESFLTEVHHVTGSGENGGVVYSEMRNHEYEMSNVIDYNLRRMLYPEGCGLRSETGGRIKELRSITLKQIKDFHETHYRWETISLIVVGMVPTDALLHKLTYVENLYDAKKTNSGHRAWSAEIPRTNLTKRSKLVKFPSSDPDDSLCQVVLGWRGPNWVDFEERHILSLLGEYLTCGNASPLQKLFVTVPRPVASDVSFEIESYKSAMYSISFENVEVEKSAKVDRSFNQCIERLVNSEFDLDRIRGIIVKEISTFKLHLEEDPAETGFMLPIVEYAINTSNPDKDKLRLLFDVEQLYKNDLLLRDAAFWKSKLSQYFNSMEQVKVTAAPSCNLSAKIAKDEKALKKLQTQHIKDTLGSLTKQKDLIDAANAFNSKPVPPDLVEAFPIAPIEAVNQFQFPNYGNFGKFKEEDSNQHEIAAKLKNVVFPVLATVVPSEFVELRAVYKLPLEILSLEDLQLVPILLEQLFESDIIMTKCDGTKMELSHQEFNQHLLKVATEYCAMVGISGDAPASTTFPDLVSIAIAGPKENSREIIQVLEAVCKQLVPSSARLLNLATNVLSEIKRRKRRGTTIAASIETALRHKSSASRIRMSLAFQLSTLKKICANPESYLERIKTLYKKVFNSKFFLQIVCNESLFDSEFVESLNKLCSEPQIDAPYDILEYLSLPAYSDTRNTVDPPFGKIVSSGCASKDPGCSIISVEGVQDFKSREAASIAVLCEMLSSCDGPLFKAVRGSGAAYSVHCWNSCFTGDCFLRLNSTSNVVQALEKCKVIFTSLMAENSDTVVIQPIFDSARCACLFHTIKSAATMADYACDQLLHLLLGLDETYNQEFIKKVSAVTVQDVAAVARTYLRKFFDAAEDRAVVVVAGSHELSGVCESLQESNVLGANIAQITYDRFAMWERTGDLDHITDEEKSEDEKESDDSQESYSSDEPY